MPPSSKTLSILALAVALFFEPVLRPGAETDAGPGRSSRRRGAASGWCR